LPEAADTAVIVNEVGAIGLDGAIIAEDGGIPVTLLSNGCICCMTGGDLERAVERLLAVRAQAGLPPPSRVVLETSGVSKPGPILRSLAALAPLRMRIAVVSTFDCTRGTAVAEFEEAAAQWAGAQTIVLTKLDAVDEAGRADARAAATGVNPLATLIDEADRTAAVRTAFELNGAKPRSLVATALAEGAAHPRIRVLLVRFSAPVRWDDLAAFLDGLAGFCGDRLLRVKGVVGVTDAGAPVLVQSVGTLFSPPRSFAGYQGEADFLVLIVRDLGAEELAPLAGALPVTLTETARG